MYVASILLWSRHLIILCDEVTAALKVDAVTTGLDSVPLMDLNLSLAPTANFLSTPLSLGQCGARVPAIATVDAAIINHHVGPSLSGWDHSATDPFGGFSRFLLLHISSCLMIQEKALRGVVIS